MKKKLIRKKRKSTPASGPVLIRVSKKSIASPHVVNLQTKKTQEYISPTVPVYSEQKFTQKEGRNVIDFGALVRQANIRLITPQTEVKPVLQKKEKPVARMVNIKKKKKKKYIPWNTIFFRVREWQDDVVRVLTLRRLVPAAVILLILCSLPFPVTGYYRQVKLDSAKVVEESTNAFMSLQASTLAALQSDITQAKFDLNQALLSFDTANSIIEKDHRALAYVASMLPIVGTEVKSRQHLLTAGHHLALGNTYLVKGIDAANQATSTPLTDRSFVLRNHLKSAIPQYEEALKELAHVDNGVVPDKYQQSFEDFKLLFAVFIDDMKDITDLVEVMGTIFGANDFRRYMILFQNHHEIRPTGGFMGSYAMIDVQKGKILRMDVPAGGTYDVQGQLTKYIKPPVPLQIMNKRWEFQDVNWFYDFPLTAQKAEALYQYSRGTTVDGVIALNASVLERFLRVVGPVENANYSLLLDADTALTSIQTEVETGENKKENKPKAVIAELLSQFMNGLSSIDSVQVVQLLSELHEAMEQKEIQVYMNDPVVQARLQTFGWTGAIHDIAPGQDYVAVVNTNLHGQKSDAAIQQSIEHQAIVDEKGEVTVTVTVRRKHTGTLGEQFYGVNNVSFMRLYVPNGAMLIDAGGFTYPPEEAFKIPETWYESDPDVQQVESETHIHVGSGTHITEESGKTVFGNWVMVMPGEESKTFFTYKLPFALFPSEGNAPIEKNWRSILPQQKETSRYSVVVQKQSGVNSAFTSHISYPDNWQPVWKTTDTMQVTMHGGKIETMLEQDMAIGVVMEKGE